jgi:site-specific DNA-methyltransferase (adenine-specific)
MLSEEGDLVLDPFSGRGTTLLEARMTGRVPLASDLNPIAVALSRAKNANVSAAAVLARVADLEDAYDYLLYGPEAQVQSDEIHLIFHPRTLAQLCYLRRRLLDSALDVDAFLVGVVLGIMHGGERKDGSSAYASISMPNTFSMSPEYVRRFVATNQLQRAHRDVFALLKDRVQWLFRDPFVLKRPGVVVRADARRLSEIQALESSKGRVKLVLTSPPYLDVVNYARQNWIRTWFLGEDPELISADLDDNLTLSAWMDLARDLIRQLHHFLAEDGVGVFVIGDVAKSNKSVIPLAREFLRLLFHDSSFEYIGCFSDRLQSDAKTTRIWGDTKGKATAVDRVVVVSNRVPDFRVDRLVDHLPKMAGINFEELDPAEMRRYALSFAG